MISARVIQSCLVSFRNIMKELNFLERYTRTLIPEPRHSYIDDSLLGFRGGESMGQSSTDLYGQFI